MNNKLIEQIKIMEGFRTKEYICTAKKRTQGFGRNIQDNPLSIEEKSLIQDLNNWKEEEAEKILIIDLNKAEKSLKTNFSFYNDLTQERKDVLINMCFQLGLMGLLNFNETIKYIIKEDYESASKEMLDSKWYKKDTPKRALILSEQFRTSKYI